MPLNSKDKNSPVSATFKNEPVTTIDFKKIIREIINVWYLFLGGVVLCVAMAALYTYLVSAEWKVNSKILVEDSKNAPSGLGNASGLGADFSSIFNAKSSADNEVQMLKSRQLMTNTVKQLQLNVRTYSVNGLKSTEIYQESPFKAEVKYKVDTVLFRRYTISFISNNKFRLINSKDDIDIVATVDQPVKLKQYDLTVSLFPGRQARGTYAVNIESTDATVTALNESFTAALSDKQASTIDLQLTYPHPKKGEVILDQLMNLYLLSNLQKKVKIADKTIAFIDNRISLVGTELNNVEREFERYKTRESIADISTQSKVLVSSASEYYDKLNQQETQLNVYNDLVKLLNNPSNKSVIPSSMIAPGDVGFGQTINVYNQLLIDRDRATLGYKPGSPIIQNFDKQIETARQSLLKSIEGSKKALQATLKTLKVQNNSFTNQLQQVPAKERGYLDFQRKQSLKQDLYLYLLQKREETAISKTSTISSSSIVDDAKSDFFRASPNKRIVYSLGFLMGLILPTFYLFIAQLFNTRIKSREDITAATNIAVIGNISNNSTGENLVTIRNSRSVISEQFRSMRTKMNYLVDQNQPNVILFTSSMSGEGKTFISLNLGSSLALNDKKVVFIELDLRKPKLSEAIGVDHNAYGFSNFAISDTYDLKKLVQPAPFSSNCSIITAGPIPPNPAELLSSPKLGMLIQDLKKTYDYIIIDCAPVGLVTDALLIEKYADLTLYIVRERYTYKAQIDMINDLQESGEIRKLYLVVNDIKAQQGGYSAYGYGGYGIEEDSSWFKKLFKKN